MPSRSTSPFHVLALRRTFEPISGTSEASTIDAPCGPSVIQSYPRPVTHLVTLRPCHSVRVTYSARAVVFTVLKLSAGSGARTRDLRMSQTFQRGCCAHRLASKAAL